jgi:hypothetical protein
MAAPLLVIPVVFAAFLGGAHLAPWVASVGAATTDIDGVIVDVDRLCRATDPLLDALVDHNRSARLLADIARAADRICAIAAAGPGVATDMRLVAATLQAIGSVQADLRSAAPGAAVTDATAPAKAGR